MTINPTQSQKTSQQLPNQEGETILHVAAKKGHLNLVKWLIDEKHMDPKLAGGKNEAHPIHYGAKGGHRFLSY